MQWRTTNITLGAKFVTFLFKILGISHHNWTNASLQIDAIHRFGEHIVYTFTIHTSDNNKKEYCTKQFRYAHLTISAKNELKYFN